MIQNLHDLTVLKIKMPAEFVLSFVLSKRIFIKYIKGYKRDWQVEPEPGGGSQDLTELVKYETTAQRARLVRIWQDG